MYDRSDVGMKGRQMVALRNTTHTIVEDTVPIRFVAKVADSSPKFIQLTPNATGFVSQA